MTTHQTKVVIIGAGLSGLYAGYLLERMGVRDYVLLESRSRAGGRIETFRPIPPSTGSKDDRSKDVNGFDLGPTWFWPAFQREFSDVVRDLGLSAFAQHESGDMVVERSIDEQPTRMRGFINSPASMRILGGMGALIEKLEQRLSKQKLLLDKTVRSIESFERYVEVHSVGASGESTRWKASHVLLALPPRLAANTIQFKPRLPDALARHWLSTPTWMAPHAKYVAVYDEAFWRRAGLSGEARSVRGPMGEMHDASMPGGLNALFGFISLPAKDRHGLHPESLKELCRAQLGRLFGSEALLPVADELKDWSSDRFTATSDDVHAQGHHGLAPSCRTDTGAWRGYLTGIGSEWGVQFPGYLAGSIEAAATGVASLSNSIMSEEDFTSAFPL